MTRHRVRVGTVRLLAALSLALASLITLTLAPGASAQTPCGVGGYPPCVAASTTGSSLTVTQNGRTTTVPNTQNVRKAIQQDQKASAAAIIATQHAQQVCAKQGNNSAACKAAQAQATRAQQKFQAAQAHLAKVLAAAIPHGVPNTGGGGMALASILSTSKQIAAPNGQVLPGLGSTVASLTNSPRGITQLPATGGGSGLPVNGLPVVLGLLALLLGAALRRLLR